MFQTLLTFFLNNYNGGSLKPIFDLFRENSFDISKVVKSLNPEILAPIIKQFTSAKKTNPTESVGFGEGLKPIATFADKDVVYTLNKYFYSV